TKLKIAFDTGIHDTVGIDLVAMCVNDIITSGAEPLFFLDYIACDKVDPIKISQIVSGISEGCYQAEAALIGGETAEMSDMYSKDEYDLAGFAVGVVDKNNIIDGSLIRKGDIILGIPSSGFHSNGYSLIRHILFKINDFKINDFIDELNSPLNKLLLMPTKIYHRTIKDITKQVIVKGIAHITGGGIVENTIRILPNNLKINLFEWEIPKLFKWIQRVGNVKNEEMFRVFNMGVGMVVIISPSDELKVNEIVNGEAIRVGEII
ncbi:MAG: phosphoribosylformylglycinamidine cyclo-ligase, partial [Spirochaetota bacterium]|nr:phosphoribosylformylglycinamidine cyclo-ligase [Spirochaetota bacterium]